MTDVTWRCSDLGNEILALNIQMSETELKNFQRNKDLGNEILVLSVQMSEAELKNFQRNKLRKNVLFYII